jgi:iron complex transport system substrate-binding protein
VTRVDVGNSAALLGALALALLGGIDRRPRDRAVTSQAAMEIGTVRKVPHPAGGLGVVDASGRIVPLRPYRRIVSTSLLSDRLLVDLAEPDRVLAISETSARQSPWRWRFAGKRSVDGMGPLEPLIALKPDLVLMNVFGGESRTEKLRDAGIEVFNLGELRGVSTLLPTTEVIAELLGDGARGRRYAESFRQRLERVALPLGDRPRRRAIYLSAMGMLLLGGSTGTSYHDVLHYGGLVDLAAGRYKGWIQYRPEEIAALDPEVVVTKEGVVEALCGHPGLERLAACADRSHRVLALPGGLLDEPGVAILDAAELLFARAYPELSVPAPPPAR